MATFVIKYERIGGPLATTMDYAGEFWGALGDRAIQAAGPDIPFINDYAQRQLDERISIFFGWLSNPGPWSGFARARYFRLSDPTFGSDWPPPAIWSAGNVPLWGGASFPQNNNHRETLHGPSGDKHTHRLVTLPRGAGSGE